MRAVRVGVIGGTGFESPAFLADATDEVVRTPYGLARAAVGRAAGFEVAFLLRHGPGHRLPPHRVNYRANVWALRELGVRRVLATAAVGALRREPGLAPGSIVLCDQFLDFTRNRPTTFFDGDPGPVRHVDMTRPYCPELRRAMREAAEALGLPVRDGGTYVCTEGPRFESAAEIRAFALLGGDVVGMTGLPEAALARELGLCYQPVALVANWAAGVGDGAVSEEEVAAALAGMRERVAALVQAALGRLAPEPACACGEAAGLG